MPGVVYMDHGARVDWIIPGKVDRGGAINLISSRWHYLQELCRAWLPAVIWLRLKKSAWHEMEEWKKAVSGSL